MKVSIELSPADAERLRNEAGRLGVTAERLAQAAVSDLLAREHDDFEVAARRVVDKNRELYRRLAWMRYLSLAEVLELHRMIIEQAGGSSGLRDLGAVESAVAQPRMTSGGADLYPSLVEKAAALCFSLVKNHPFIDGNKRVGHAAMETFLVLNGLEIDASIDEQEQLLLSLAAGQLSREDFVRWLHEHVREA